MRSLTFTISAGLAVTGMALSIAGIMGGELREFFIGGVLLAGAGVFAILHIATRTRANGADSL